jgi:hypothetical protein
MSQIEPSNEAPILLPVQEEPLPADDAFARLESEAAVSTPDDLFVTEEEKPPIGRSWAYDFAAGRFIRSPQARGPLAISGSSTLEQWVEKCMRTARGAHPVHENFGMEGPGDFIGVSVDEFPLDEFRDRVTEALLRHPRIDDTTDWSTDYDDDEEYVVVSFSVVTDAGLEIPIETRLGD